MLVVALWEILPMMCLLFTATPSPELVERVRDLYHKRVPDVRFLIPVLNGLTKVRFFIEVATDY